MDDIDLAQWRTAKYGKARLFYEEVVLPYDGDECLLWPFAKNRQGYAQLWYNGRLTRANRLVCEEEHGQAPSPEHEAAHSCGNTSCVARGHLSWKPHAENEADKLIHGTHNRGERCANAKLTESDVHKIRALRGSKEQAEIGRMFGVSQGAVANIHRGHVWAWLPAQ